MTFWLDDSRNLVIYPGQPGPLAQYIPDLKTINGSYFCLPKTLQNLQVLSWYNWPTPFVMTDSNYDWPIEPGKTPLPHQKIYANFTALHPRMFNLGDPGCVAGGTLIETDEGPTRIDVLANRGKGIKVFASTDEGVRLVSAECPFLKGFEPLYRVTFQSGCSIDVTSRHVFLTCRGWVSCADLVVGELLPKFAADHPASNSESYLSVLRQDVRRSKQTTSDFRDCSDTLVCDAPLPRDEDSGQFSIPSQVDVLTRNQTSSKTDGPDTKYKHTGQSVCAHRSTRGCEHLSDRVGTEFLAGESISKRVYNQPHAFGQFHPTTFRKQPTQPDSELAYDCFARCPEYSECCAFGRGIEQPGSSRPVFAPLVESTSHFQSTYELLSRRDRQEPPLDLPLDTVVHIAYLKTDFYYDMHVPVHQNYIAHGICNHNTMKTLSTLWALDFLMLNAKIPFKALIVAPLTLLDTVWASAIFRNFLGRRTFEILTGTSEQRIRKLESDVDIYLVNHDGLKVGAHIRRKVDPRRPNQKRVELDGFSKALAARSDIKLVVIDEASGFKDHTTARHACATMIFGRVPHLKQLTGSPTSNRPTDAYGLAKLSNDAFGKSFNRFRLETMLQVSTYKWVPQRDGYDKAKRLLTPAVRFALDEIWNGPPMTFQRRKVELTTEQKEHMRKLKAELQILTRTGQAIDAANESAARQKLIQISLGAVYDGDHLAHTVDASPRYAELEEIIESTERKVVIFVPITSVVHRTVQYLREVWKKQHRPWTCDFINGEVDAKKDRPRIIQAFASDPDFKAIIVDPGVTAHGINEFVVADTAVWFGATDKAELWIQGNARIRRPGQKYPSTCFQIVSNKLEEEIFTRLETNTSMMGLMLEAIRKGEF